MNELYENSVDLVTLVAEINKQIPDIKPFDIHLKVKDIPKFKALAKCNKSLYQGILQGNVNLKNIYILKKMLHIKNSSKENKNEEVSEYLAKEHGVDWSKTKK